MTYLSSFKDDFLKFCDFVISPIPPHPTTRLPKTWIGFPQGPVSRQSRCSFPLVPLYIFRLYLRPLPFSALKTIVVLFSNGARLLSHYSCFTTNNSFYPLNQPLIYSVTQISRFSSPTSALRSSPQILPLGGVILSVVCLPLDFYLGTL